MNFTPPPPVHPRFDALARHVKSSAQRAADISRRQKLTRRAWAPVFGQINAELNRVRAQRRGDTLFYKYLQTLKAYLRENCRTSRHKLAAKHKVPNHGRLWQDWGTVIDPSGQLRAQAGAEWVQRCLPTATKTNPFDITPAQTKLLEKWYGNRD